MTIKKDPLISIYITNYNYGKYIAKAIRSCLKQTFKEKEIIIIDDGSTDGSKKIINKFVSKYPSLKTIFKKNQGLVKACNTALKVSRGKYIIRLDADDWLDKNAIEIMYSKVVKDKKIDLLFSDYFEVNNSGEITNLIRRHDFKNVKLFDQPAHGACTLFKKKTLLENGGYDESFSCQDGVDIWYRFQKKFKIMNVNIPLFFYRRHGHNLTEKTKRILNTRSKILFKNNENNSNKTVVGFIPVRGEKYDKYSTTFRKIGNKYLIDWTLDSMLNSKILSHIIVSSPDMKVLNYVKNKKNKKIFPIKRSPKLVGTNISLDLSVKEAANFFQKKFKKKIDITVISKLNNPFRDYKHIDNAINTIQIFDLDLVIGVTNQNKMYFQHNGKTLKPIKIIDNQSLKLSQKNKINIKIESKELYEERGSFFVYNNNKINNFDNYNNLRIGHETLSKLSAFELDSSLEWYLAEQISKKYRKLKNEF